MVFWGLRIEMWGCWGWPFWRGCLGFGVWGWWRGLCRILLSVFCWFGFTGIVVCWFLIGFKIGCFLGWFWGWNLGILFVWSVWFRSLVFGSVVLCLAGAWWSCRGKGRPLFLFCSSYVCLCCVYWFVVVIIVFVWLIS